MFNINDYDYTLPQELIAQHPCDKADECKLLIVDDNWIKDLQFKEIENIIDKNTVMFLNNTKVIKSRIPLINVKVYSDKSSREKKIDKWELFFLKMIDTNKFEALVYPWKKFQVWHVLVLWWYELKVLEITLEWRIFETNCPDIEELLDRIWQMPLPPYIKYSKDKEHPYQTIFAAKSWSTASPTASLHFTKELINNIEEKWIIIEYWTLHIWLWTFKKVDVEKIKDYDIHKEQVEFDLNIFQKIESIKKSNKKILSIWTTITRSLESLPYLRKINKIWKNEYRDNLTKEITIEQAKEFIHNIIIENNIIKFETKLFIYPWRKFYITDELITNFHLPKSSLLMLVSAFVWFNETKQIYEYAINNNYRFFSFGDAMYIKLK